MAIKPPCKDCDRREIGCHSHCKEYKEYRRLIDARKEAEKSKKEADIICEEITVKRIIRTKKYHMQ